MRHICKPGIFLCSILSYMFIFYAFSPIAYAQEDTILALDTPNETISIAPDGQGGFYSLSPSGIDHFIWDSKQFQSVSFPETDIFALSWDGSKLVGLGNGGNTIYRLDGSRWVPACELSTESAVQFNFSYSNLPHQFIASSDFFIITYYDAITRQEATCIINSSTGKSKVIDQANIYPLCLYEGQSILAMATQNGQYGVFRFDLISGQAEPFTLPKLPLLFLAAAYNQHTDTLYVVDEAGQLYSSQNKKEAVFINNVSGLSGLVALSDMWVALLNSNRIYLCNTAKMQNAPIITVLGSGLLDNAGFTAATGIRVVEAVSHYSVMEHMSFAMASKDSTIDIYSFIPYQGLDIVKKKGMFYDLRQSQVLYELSKELYPKVLKAIQGPNGELVCWFTDLQVVLRTDDGAQAILSQYGLKYPNTFEELLDVTQTLQEMGVLDELDLKPFDSISYTQKDLLRYFMNLYIMQKQMTGDRLHFNTPTFKRIVTRIITEIPTVDTDEALDDERNFLFTLEIISPIINKDMQPPIQVDADTPSAIHTFSTVCVINPASAHLPEALAYLEYAAKKKDEYAYGWYKSMTEPMRDPQIAAIIETRKADLKALEEALLTTDEPAGIRAEIEALQSQITQLENTGWIISPEAIAHYSEMADRLFISEGMSVTMDEGIKNYQAQLLGGVIDVPTFIRLCENRVSMIYAEQD